MEDLHSIKIYIIKCTIIFSSYNVRTKSLAIVNKAFFYTFPKITQNLLISADLLHYLKQIFMQCKQELLL